MAAVILKQGSKGKLVLILHKFLNLKGKLTTPLPETEEFGPETKEAVRGFQKRTGLTVDGAVGPETASALAKLVGPSAAAFAKAFGNGAADKKGPGKKEEEKEQGKTEEKHYAVNAKGKVYVFTQKEFEEFNKQMLAELKRTAVLAAEQRIDSARILWDTFHDINKDQYIVSWFVSLAGPKLPDEGVVKAGEQAFQKLKAAVDSSDYQKIAAELKNVSEPINHAYETMMKYREAVIGRGETWVAGLEFTRDTSFDIVSAIATAELGGTVASGAVAGGGSELVKSAAGEFGKYLAGTSGGGAAAAKNIVLDGLLGAATGAASTLMKLKGDQIVKGVAESAAKKLTGKWLARVGSDKLEKFIARRLEGAASGGLEAAIKNASKAIKGDTTPEQFFAEVAKGMGFGSVLNGLDSWVESKKFPETVYNKMNSSLRTKFFGKLGKDEAIKLMDEVIKGKASEGVKKSLEFAFEKAKGNESAEDLGAAAAEQFADASVKNLEAEIAKRIKK